MVKTSICLANSIIDINLSPVQNKDSKIGCLLLKTRFDFLKITYARLLIVRECIDKIGAKAPYIYFAIQSGKRWLHNFKFEIHWERSH